eukprot:3047-Heterococcus_DN1.PRE.1
MLPAASMSLIAVLVIKNCLFSLKAAIIACVSQSVTAGTVVVLQRHIAHVRYSACPQLVVLHVKSKCCSALITTMKSLCFFTYDVVRLHYETSCLDYASHTCAARCLRTFASTWVALALAVAHHCSCKA